MEAEVEEDDYAGEKKEVAGRGGVGCGGWGSGRLGKDVASIAAP